MRKLILSILVSVPLLGGNIACAQQPRKTASSGAVATIKEATSRTTLPGRKEMEPSTEYRFVIIWNSNTLPTSIFWKPDNKEWMSVQVARPENQPIFPGSPDYRTLEKIIKPTDVRKGDQLILTTRHRHDAPLMPAAVKKMPAQSLYYQSKAGGWNVIRIAKLRKLPDITLP